MVKMEKDRREASTDSISKSNFLEGITMRNWMWAVLATGCLLAGFGTVSADDTVRLGGPSAQADVQGGTDTDLVRWGRGGYGGYNRGGYGGHYRGGYGYYRGYYGGYGRPYYYGGYYAPAYYYPPTYYAPTYYAPRAIRYYSYPINGESSPPPATTMQGSFYPSQSQQPFGNGTFPYDGGPRAPVPMPNPSSDANPANTPRRPANRRPTRVAADRYHRRHLPTRRVASALRQPAAHQLPRLRRGPDHAGATQEQSLIWLAYQPAAQARDRQNPLLASRASAIRVPFRCSTTTRLPTTNARSMSGNSGWRASAKPGSCA